LKINVTNKKVTVKVEDNGIGIPKEDQKNLFTKFFRAGNALNIEGTGLGLNIVKRYVELIDGTISFTSTIEEGSSFTVQFPRSISS
jgi:signal transduction histidine kinase